MSETISGVASLYLLDRRDVLAYVTQTTGPPDDRYLYRLSENEVDRIEALVASVPVRKRQRDRAAVRHALGLPPLTT